MKRHIFISALVGLASGLSAPVLAGEHGAAGHTLLLPNTLEWTDAKALPCGTKTAVLQGPLDKDKPFTFRAKLPDGCMIPAHWHSSAEHVTVLSGTLNLGFGSTFDKAKLTPIPAGGMAIMPPKVEHFVLTQGETIIQVHGIGPWGITYVTPRMIRASARIEVVPRARGRPSSPGTAVCCPVISGERPFLGCGAGAI